MQTYPEFMDLVRGRYSCRSFETTPLSDDLVMAVLESAHLAPSACNLQPWTFVVVRDAETRSRILAKSRPAFMDAPAVIVACGHHSQAWHRGCDNKDHTDIDVAIAVEHLCLAATSLGLGTCWVCSFDVEATRRCLQLPDDVEPVALLPIGYIKGDNPMEIKKRKPLDEIVRWEKY